MMDEAFVKLLMQNIEQQTEKIESISDDVGEIKTKIAVMEANEQSLLNCAPQISTKKTRIKDSAAGGGLGGVFVAVIIGIYEYFAK